MATLSATPMNRRKMTYNFPDKLKDSGYGMCGIEIEQIVDDG